MLVDDGGSGGSRYWIYDLNTGASTAMAPDLSPTPTARINDHGAVAFTVAPGYGSRTYLWEDGAATFIEGLAGSVDDEVVDFNNLGQVLGRSIRTSGNQSTWDAFLYEKGEGTVSLSSLINPTDLAAWAGISVSRINDQGDIVGHGVKVGEREWTPFILRNVAAPVPEPATWLMGFLGAGVLVARRRRFRRPG